LGTSLFSQAIANSPYLPPVYPFYDTIPEEHYNLFAQESGCLNSSDVFGCLVGTDMATLMHASAIVATSGPFGTSSWNPVNPSHRRLIVGPRWNLCGKPTYRTTFGWDSQRKPDSDWQQPKRNFVDAKFR
jgi:hypothetical protein